MLNYGNAKASIIRRLSELQRKSAGLPSSRKNHLNCPCKKIKNFLGESRFGAIPIAFIYGILIYLYLTCIIFPNVDIYQEKETDVKKKSKTPFCFSKEILDLFPNDTSPQKVTNAKCHLPEEISIRNYRTGLYISWAFTLTIGTASIFSIRTRCIMMLIMPGIVTDRGRGFLLTMVVGLLIEGPFDSINYNIKQIIESTVCMHKSMKNIACQILKESQQKMVVVEELKRIQDKVKQVRDAVKNGLEKKQQELKECINKPYTENELLLVFFGKKRDVRAKICVKQLNEWVKDVVPEIKVKLGDVPGIKKLLDSPSVADIREKMLNFVRNFFEKLLYLKYAKKFFILCSLIFLTLGAVRYLFNYSSNDSFDNKFIDDNVRKLWKRENYEKLTPLRRWELEKYQMTASVKLSKKDFKGILIKTFPTIMMGVITSFLIIGDYGLSELLRTLLANGKFAISFAGMEEGFGAEARFHALNKNSTWNMKPLNLSKLDLSMDPCLPKPLFTDKVKNIFLGVLLFAMLLSSVFDVYAMRLRVNICNIFYKKRARERAIMLHEVILYGRRTRQVRLPGIILNELRRRKRINKSSWLLQLIYACFKSKTKNDVICPGCFQKSKIEKTIKVTVTDKEMKMECQLCNDCYKDYLEPMEESTVTC